MTEEDRLEIVKSKILEKYFPTKAIVNAIADLKCEIKKLSEKETVLNVEALNVTVEPTEVKIDKTEIDYSKLPTRFEIINTKDLKNDVIVEKTDIKPIVLSVKKLEETIKQHLTKLADSPLLKPLIEIADSVENPIEEVVSRDSKGNITKIVRTFSDRKEITTTSRDKDGNLIKVTNESI